MNILIKLFKILLSFFAGIIGAFALSAFFGFIFNYEMFKSLTLAISIPLGVFLGIRLSLKLIKEKTNYLYLFLIATLLAVAAFLFQLSIGSSFDQYLSLIYIIFSSVILTVMANLFISKRIK